MPPRRSRDRTTCTPSSRAARRATISRPSRASWPRTTAATPRCCATISPAPKSRSSRSRVTEKGYRRGADGRLDVTDSDITADICALGEAFADRENPPGAIANGVLRTMPARLLWALDARRRALPDDTITLIPCDNLDDNGTALRSVVGDLAALTSPSLGAWIDAQVDVVSTSVDRITPRTTADDIDAVAAREGIRDEALVVTEPFHSWILSGRIRADRPRWEDAGASFVSDIEPFRAAQTVDAQRRALPSRLRRHPARTRDRRRGHRRPGMRSSRARPVGSRPAAPRCLRSQSRRRASTFPPTGRRLLERFANPAIVHRLRQIARGRESQACAPASSSRCAAPAPTCETGAAGIAALAAWARFVIAEVHAGRPLDEVAAEELGARATDCRSASRPARPARAPISPRTPPCSGCSPTTSADQPH